MTRMEFQEWVSIGEEDYKFVETPYGVTRDEAKEICQANGGFLAEILNEDQRKALQTYYEANLVPRPQSYFLAALDFISGKRQALKRKFKHLKTSSYV